MASNGFLSASLPNGTPANRRRSASITPSQRSSRSRITLVENDPDLVADDVVKSEGINKVVIYKTPKYTWRDHLRGVFGFKVSKGKEFFVEENFEQPEVLQEPEVPPPHLELQRLVLTYILQDGSKFLTMDSSGLRSLYPKRYG